MAERGMKSGKLRDHCQYETYTFAIYTLINKPSRDKILIFLQLEFALSNALYLPAKHNTAIWSHNIISQGI